MANGDRQLQLLNRRDEGLGFVAYTNLEEPIHDDFISRLKKCHHLFEIFDLFNRPPEVIVMQVDHWKRPRGFFDLRLVEHFYELVLVDHRVDGRGYLVVASHFDYQD